MSDQSNPLDNFFNSINVVIKSVDEKDISQHEIHMVAKERLAYQILKTTLPPFQPFTTYQ